MVWGIFKFRNENNDERGWLARNREHADKIMGELAVRKLRFVMLRGPIYED